MYGIKDIFKVTKVCGISFECEELLPLQTYRPSKSVYKDNGCDTIGIAKEIANYVESNAVINNDFIYVGYLRIEYSVSEFVTSPNQTESTADYVIQFNSKVTLQSAIALLLFRLVEYGDIQSYCKLPSAKMLEQSLLAKGNLITNKMFNDKLREIINFISAKGVEEVDTKYTIVEMAVEIREGKGEFLNEVSPLEDWKESRDYYAEYFTKLFASLFTDKDTNSSSNDKPNRVIKFYKDYESPEQGVETFPDSIGIKEAIDLGFEKCIFEDRYNHGCVIEIHFDNQHFKCNVPEHLVDDICYVRLLSDALKIVWSKLSNGGSENGFYIQEPYELAEKIMNNKSLGDSQVIDSEIFVVCFSGLSFENSLVVEYSDNLSKDGVMAMFDGFIEQNNITSYGFEIWINNIFYPDTECEIGTMRDKFSHDVDYVLRYLNVKARKRKFRETTNPFSSSISKMAGD